MTLLRAASAVALAALLTQAVPPAPAGAAEVTNLGESKADALRILSQGELQVFGASSFTVDGSDHVLDAVTLALTFQEIDPHDGGFFVEIRSDAAGNPGALLTNGALTGPSNPLTSSATYTASGLTLSANTTYWVVAGTEPGGGWYRWDLTYSDAQTGNWTIGDQSARRSEDRGASWSQVSSEDGPVVGMFRIDATVIPANACPCWPGGVPLASPLLCYAGPGPQTNTFAYSAPPPSFLQATNLWCRDNFAFRWTNAAQSQTCDESLQCLCNNPSPGPEVCDDGVDNDCDGNTDGDDGSCGSIDLEKEVSVDDGTTWFDADEPPGPTTSRDDDVLFRFTVTNTGQLPLSEISLTDPGFQAEIDATCAIPPSLGLGESAQCVICPFGAQADQNQNEATATAEPQGATDSDRAHYRGGGGGGS